MMKTPPHSKAVTIFALVALVAVVAPRSVFAACDCTTLPTLGAAADFPALGLVGTDVELIGSVLADSTHVGPATEANLGVGSGGTVLIQGAASILGHVHHHTGTTVTGGASAAGGVFEVDMTTVVADAIAASAAFAALGTTQSFAGINRNTTVTGNGCINIISVTGDITLNSNKILTIRGTADDYFIFNITGHLMVSGNARIVLDGLNPHQVLFNMIGANEVVDIDGNASADGTFLNTTGEVNLQGNAGGRGAYYSGGPLLHFQGNADYYAEAFSCGVTPLCPDPEASGVNIQTPATPIQRSSGNTSFYHAYYDTTTYEGHLEAFRVNPAGELRDELDVLATDVNGLLVNTRTPYWDAGILLRTDNSRNIFTTKSGSRAIFNTTNVTDVDLEISAGEIPAYPNHPTSTVTTVPLLNTAIVDYVYGKDSFDQDSDMSLVDLRAAVLGDIFHSNALFVGTPQTLLFHENGFPGYYNAYEQRDRVVYAGANDGMLHAFDAGAWWNPSDPTAFNDGTGEELFGYVPGLLLPIVKVLPRNIDQDGNRLIPGFVDGNTIAADAWLGDGSGTDVTKTPEEWATVLMSAYRDGGKGYLALDVTRPGAGPGVDHGPYPKLLWEFTHAKMGDSWSRPVITRVKLGAPLLTGDKCGENDGDGNCREQWVAIFGAGHHYDSDPNDDGYFADDTNPAWNAESKAIFMVALDTGAVIASASFDSAVTSTTKTMRYGFPSAPAVLDIDHDGFADVVYIGDTAGQMWKWDISAVGVDGVDADLLMDNFPIGVFFRSAPVVLGTGDTHYRSIYAPAAAALVNGVLKLAFGTGERRDILYPGDNLKDDNNRFYVIDDAMPTGFSTPVVPLTEANLVNVTAAGTLAVDPTKKGYYIVATEGEKFFTDVVIFANHIIAASYDDPDPYPTCGSGVAYLYVFELSDSEGFFDDNATAEAVDRRVAIGSGVPSSPRVTIATDPSDDIVFVTTSDGQVVTVEPPLRDPPSSELLYWREMF